MRYVSTWDGVGAGISGLCMIHCVALPVLLAAAPGLGYLLDESVHRTLVAVLVVPTVLAFVPGYRLHRRWAPPLLATAGFALLALGAFGEVGAWEEPLTVAGSLLLVTAHYLNHSFCRLCRFARGVPEAASPEDAEARQWNACDCSEERRH